MRVLGVNLQEGWGWGGGLKKIRRVCMNDRYNFSLRKAAILHTIHF